MKAIRRVTSVLLLVIAIILSLFAFSAPAQASSDYDALLQVTPSLTVYTDGATKSTTMDISSTWWRDYKQTYDRRVVPLGWPTNFTTKFEEYVSSGGSWGVYTYETVNGIVIHIVGTNDPHAACGFVGAASTATFNCTVHAGYRYVYNGGYFTHSSYGGNGCGGNSCSDNGMGAYSEPYVYGIAETDYAPISISHSEFANTKFFVWNFDTTYPSGYAGTVLPNTRNAISGFDYVAMGDSYSSGEGLSPFETLSNMTGVDECHRSADAYPYTLDSSLSLGSMGFVACSGATTDTLMYGGGGTTGVWGEAPQVGALGSATDIVTLTIGGNDLGFTNVMEDCIEDLASAGYGCASDTDITNPVDDRLLGLDGTAAVYQYTAGTPSRLIHSLQDVLALTAINAPNAEIYIAGYPHLFGSSLTDYMWDAGVPGGGKCQVGYWGGTLLVSYADAQWINSEVDALNTAIEDAVTYAQNQSIDVTYVSPSSFGSHGLCDSSTAWINGVSLSGSNPLAPTVLPETFHPTQDGVDAYEAAFEDAITNHL